MSRLSRVEENVCQDTVRGNGFGPEFSPTNLHILLSIHFLLFLFPTLSLSFVNPPATKASLAVVLIIRNRSGPS
jgi:hypothetical protein